MSVVVRILLRYLSGSLVTIGLLTAADAELFVVDHDIIMITSFLVGLAISAISECWYALAKKLGWRT